MATLGELIQWVLIGVADTWRRITRRVLRRRRNRQIFASDRRFRGLVEHAPDGIVIVNWHGHIELVNVQAQELFGYEEEELVGQNLIDLVPHRYRDAHRVHMKGYMQSARVRPMGMDLELFGLRKDGGEFPVEISLGPLETDHGLLVSCHVRDISARKAAEAELQERAMALERSNADLEQFAYVASHDLSTPLRSIEGFTTLLRQRYHGQLGEEGNGFIDYTQRAAERMRALIDDLLAYSRVSAREVPLARVDANMVVATALELFEAEVVDTHAAITVRPLPDVRGDEGRLVQLFQNLLGNAVKFAGDRPPEVEISAVHAGDGMWRFAVHDHGIGLDPEHADRIFTMFGRLHSPEEFEGTGIGLAICKRIVEQHGGEITVTSAPGRGATFSFTLRGAPGP